MAADSKIRFACSHCGHPVAIAAAHAGKRGKCPKCGGIIEIPAAAPASMPALAVAAPPVATAAEPACPSCKAALKPAAVLCVNCGLDLRTGKKLAGAAAEPPPHAVANSSVAEIAAAARSANAAIRGAKQMTIETPPAVLWCPSCQREYWINADSIIFPGEELLKELTRQGSTVVNLSGGSLPDTVRTFDFDSLPRDKADIRRKLNEAVIKKALRDPARRWSCQHCAALHDYSTTREPDLTIPPEDVLDVQEAVFRVLISLYAPRWPKEPTVLYFTVQDRDPAIGLLERFGYHAGQARGAFTLQRMDGLIVLEVRNQKFKTPHLCLATGTLSCSIAKYRIVRAGSRWKVDEINPLLEMKQHFGE